MNSEEYFHPSVDARAQTAEPGQALQVILEHAPSAFAVTLGPVYTVTYANAAFRRLVGVSSVGPGIPLADVLLPEAIVRLESLLDRAMTGGEVLQDRFLGSVAKGTDYWSCNIWPLFHASAAPRGLVIEFHKSAPTPPSVALQREVAERLLLSTLREVEATESAETSLILLEYLDNASQRLVGSRDTSMTRQTVAGIALPILGTWCIVDLIEVDGSISRLAMIHPDPEKQALLRDLARNWHPEPGDPFGGPAIQLGSMPLLIADNVDGALEAAAHSPDNLRLLRELQIGTLLTVPMSRGGRLLGGVTFVTGKPGRAYSSQEIRLAQNLAARSAEALESARSYDEALALRDQAELATNNRTSFLGNISHELRTPLNAILGYVDVIAEGIHGPVTPVQLADLERIRSNQEHLLRLANDLVAYVRAGKPRINQIMQIPAHKAVAQTVALIENLLVKKSLDYQSDPEDPDVIAVGDAERVKQILVNLLANAVKFTQRGGQITTRCEAVGEQVRISVIDNGVGIAPTKLAAIFEPFVQVDPEHRTDSGVGLGLAISRDLARTMHGDLTVESEVGVGSCFVLTLPRAIA